MKSVVHENMKGKQNSNENMQRRGRGAVLYYYLVNIIFKFIIRW